METRHAEMRDGQVLTVRAANIHAMLTGASHATQDNCGRVTLHYVDGTTETVMLQCDVDKAASSWLDLVTKIQTKARKEAQS